MFQKLFFLFLIIPILEVFILLRVGSFIGFFPTILLIIGTAALGAHLTRSQGLSIWFKLQQQLQQGITPEATLIEGVFILVAGALLLTPGLLTDIVGFSLLYPDFRAYLIQAIPIKPMQSMQAKAFTSNRFGQASQKEAEYTIVEEEKDS
jgi:UPF0716 protein FxsA